MKILIVGGGIGGLTTALSLNAVGIDCAVYEKSHRIRELGVGINMLPHAVKELGQRLWRELRGLHAGYDFPQFSVHRGKLQGLLHAAARGHIGNDRIHTDRQLCGFAQTDDGVAATFVGA